MSRESSSKCRQIAASSQGQSLQERLSAVSVSLIPFATAARIDAEQLPTRVSPKTLKAARSGLEEIARLLNTGDIDNAARFALGQHSLYEILLPAFAWLDRWTLRRSLTEDDTSLLTSLHIGLQCVLEHLLLRRTSLDSTQAQLHQYVRFALAFVRSDALCCLALRMDSLRKRAAAASKDQFSAEHIGLLRISIASVEHDVTLARAVWVADDEHVPALRQARDAAFAASHAIQHMCATVMTLTEWLPGLEVDFGKALAGTRITSLDGAPVMEVGPQGTCRLVDLRIRLAEAANDLMAFLAHVVRGAAGSRPGVEVVHGRMLCTAWANPHPQLLPVLLHPAVQYFLGWAAVGLPTPAELKGSHWDGTFGDVTVPLLRGCREPDAATQGYQAKLKDMRELLQVLQAVAGAWSAALRSGAAQPPRSPCRTTDAVPPPSPLPAAQAALASADGASSSTSATAADGLVPTAPTTSATATAAAATASPLPYRTAHMCRMLLGLFEEFWRLMDRSDEPDIRFDALEASSSLEAGLLALAECLVRLPPAAAARRLPAAWGTVGMQLACAPLSRRRYVNKAVYLVVGQLLVAMAHLQAPTEQRPGEEQGGLPGQEGGGAGAGTAAVVGGGGGLWCEDGASGSGGGGSGGGGSGGSGAEARPSCVEQGVRPPPGAGPSPALTTPKPTSIPAPPPGPSYTLSCALAASLLPCLECELRHMMMYAPDAAELAPQARAIDTALRRHGCWPAMLAHGDPRQVASLVLTLGKAALLAYFKPDVEAQGQVAGGAGGSGGRPPGGVRGLVRQQLMALLEQMGLQVIGPGGEREQGKEGQGLEGGEKGERQGQGPGQEGGAQGAQERQQGVPVLQGLVPLQLRLRSMELNRALRGEVVGVESAAGGGSSISSSSTKHAFWATGPLGSGPSWEQVVSHGGCPAPGSPQQQQLQRMAVLAAVHWLPSLLLYPYAGLPGFEPVQPVPLGSTAPNGEHRVAWAWLRLVARQLLPCTFPQMPLREPGSAAPREPMTWRQLLVRDLLGVLQVAAVIRAALAMEAADGGGASGAGGIGGGGGGEEQQQQAVRAAVEEVLPAALDVLEVLVVAEMPEVTRCLGVNAHARRKRQEGGAAAAAAAAAAAGSSRASRGARRRAGQGQGQGPGPVQRQVVPAGWGPGLPWDEAVRGLVLRQGRVRLVACLDMMARLVDGRADGGLASGEALCSELLQQVSERLCGELPQLPGPCLDVGFARCANPVCCMVTCASEARVQLLLCGRCRAVGYCSAECQKWDWAAGHKTECGAGAAGAGRRG